MQRNIDLPSDAVHCAGRLYLPDKADGPALVIVMTNGVSAVKEQGLATCAERFRAAGFAVVVFDFAHFGASQGTPHGQLFPHEMVEDHRNAITRACRQPRVDPTRVGLWGTSFSGGLAARAATVGRRVRAVVAQMPSLMKAEARRSIDPARWGAVAKMLIAERVARDATGGVRTIPAVVPDRQPCALPGFSVRREHTLVLRQRGHRPARAWVIRRCHPGHRAFGGRCLCRCPPRCPCPIPPARRQLSHRRAVPLPCGCALKASH